ncbi:hypothetical protein [Taibaiella koreensis]|uniref:hypothetical protein n=1 Tax=Taibaiella koreensis TaxID=1268548 RepID=UPI000E59D53D|nr:hypothetical protein [Taibaiella koreensis]
MKNKCLALALLSVLFVQCNERNPDSRPAEKKKPPVDEHSLPPVTELTGADRTVFVTTMEEPFTPGLNVVYTPAFLYTWDALRETQHGHLSVPAGEPILQLIHTSSSWKNTLDEGEYDKDVAVSGEMISIQTAFKRTVAFEMPFDTIADLTFLGQHVKGFGMRDYSGQLSEQVLILYYKDDEHFIVELRTRSSNDRLILARGFEQETPLSGMYAAIGKAIAQGAEEMQITEEAWKYTLNKGDRLSVPRLCFNIHAAYTTLVGRILQGEQRPLRIQKAGQRTALLLDEYGAKVESEAVLAAGSAAPGPVVQQPAPKLLLFDKPFVMLMEKPSAAFPYFMMKVENTRLMTAR